MSVPDFTLTNGQKYQGWCQKETKQVACCQNSCPGGYNCDYSQGCVKDIQFLACPLGKCCNSGGDYMPRSCGAGVQCCAGDGVVGDCKQTCVKESITSHSSGLGISGISGDYCEGGNSIFDSILGLVGDFIPGASSITSMLSTVNGAVCPQQSQEEQSQNDNLSTGGGFGSIILSLITSFF